MHIVQSTVLTLLKRQGDSTRTVFSSATFKVTLHLRAGFRCFSVRQLRPQVWAVGVFRRSGHLPVPPPFLTALGDLATSLSLLVTRPSNTKLSSRPDHNRAVGQLWNQVAPGRGGVTGTSRFKNVEDLSGRSILICLRCAPTNPVYSMQNITALHLR